ncbi:Rgg/GadR/MutR family transcriptional regulator [Vagococcus silagei]|uniref:Rgg/GadR/MutR family transcriptional regulator n=1 Tax=Vagococcus silagei TaxID=2508885 RepID=A0A4S3B5I7_9ENTE|nr:Rgg/GadR/MutR family transcriptional regulator [Vagococcus silagei]THB60716.1 Rgg/GadR/MutR family transcriptional regulator [Vagococcus silagei]
MIQDGPFFRSLRESKNMTIQSVADDLNSVSFISKFEKGNSNISLTRFERLLENINVSPEEYFYLRAVKNDTTISETFTGQDMNYLSSDFMATVAKIYQIMTFQDLQSSNYPQLIDQLESLKQNLIPTVRWQRYLIIYINILISTCRSNLEKNPNDLTIDESMQIFYQQSKPIATYLYSVDTWTAFEITLFRIFLFSFPLDTAYQLTKTALSRSEKQHSFDVIHKMRVDIMFSSFSLFCNFNQKKRAKEMLEIATRALDNDRDLENSTALLFYQGWFDIYFDNRENGIMQCNQAISIAHILKQSSLEKNFRSSLELLKSYTPNQRNFLFFT